MNNEPDEHAHIDPYENIDRSIVGSLQLQLITDAYIGFLSDQTAIFLRLDMSLAPDILAKAMAERLPKSPTEGTRLSGWRQVAIALLQATEWIPPGSAGFRI